MNTLNELLKRELVRGLKDVKFEKDKPCSACQAGKQVANTHPTKAYMSTSRVLELLHMDLFGPTTYKSLGGNLYCFVIVDDYSRYTWTFFLHDKSKVGNCFKKFAKRAQNEFEVKIKKIRVTMTKSLTTQTLKLIVMRLESSMKFHQPTLNKMV
jgi:hypothetical protein